MSIISTIADSACSSCLTVILVVSVLVGGVVLHISIKRFFTLTRGRIEQRRQVQRPQLDLGHEKINYAKLEDGQVKQEHTNQVSNATCVTLKAANHLYPLTSVVVIDAQHIRSSLVHTPQAPLAGLLQSEDWPSSFIAEADSNSRYQSTTTLISDDTMLRHVRNVDKPTSEDEPISNTENQEEEEKEKRNMAQTKRNVEPKEHQNGEEEGHRQRSEFPSLDAQHLEKLHLTGHHAADNDILGIGSKDQWWNDGDNWAQEMLQELNELGYKPSTKAGTAQQGLEALNPTEVADTPFEVGLWRLGANRCAATKAMVDVVLKVMLKDSYAS